MADIDSDDLSSAPPQPSQANPAQQQGGPGGEQPEPVRKELPTLTLRDIRGSGDPEFK